MDEPRAEIRQVGRITYAIRINTGGSVLGDWYAWGKRRAERKGQRKLAAYLLRQSREWARIDTPIARGPQPPSPTTITLDNSQGSGGGGTHAH